MVNRRGASEKARTSATGSTVGLAAGRRLPYTEGFEPSVRPRITFDRTGRSCSLSTKS